MRVLILSLLLASTAGCVGQELRHTATLTAAEAQSFKSDFVRFDQANRALIAARNDEIAMQTLQIETARRTLTAQEQSLEVDGAPEDKILYRLISRDVPQIPQKVEPVTAKAWDTGQQDALIGALNKAAKPRTEAESAGLLLGFISDVAGKMQDDVKKATKQTEAAAPKS